MITTNAMREILIGNLLSVLSGVIFHYYKAAVVLSPGMTPADFTEADYAGYASGAKAVVGTAFDDANGNALLRFADFVGNPTSDATPNTIYGWYLTGAVGGPLEGELVYAHEFVTPVALNDATDLIVTVPFVAINQPTGAIDFVP